ncbi:MAG: hypothetical protein RL092_1406 [Bacteroidota bacterium]|jgi:hypothetical protein
MVYSTETVQKLFEEVMRKFEVEVLNGGGKRDVKFYSELQKEIQRKTQHSWGDNGIYKQFYRKLALTTSDEISVSRGAFQALEQYLKSESQTQVHTSPPKRGNQSVVPTRVIHINWLAVLNFLPSSISVPKVLETSLTRVRSVAIKDESVNFSGHFQYRMALDIFNRYRRLIKYNAQEDPQRLVVILRCKLAVILQMICQRAGYPSIIVVYDDNDDSLLNSESVDYMLDSGVEFIKINSEEWQSEKEVNIRTADADLVNDLLSSRGFEKGIDYFYAQDEDYFPQDTFYARNQLYQEIIDTNCNRIYIPTRFGDILKGISLQLLHDLEVSKSRVDYFKQRPVTYELRGCLGEGIDSVDFKDELLYTQNLAIDKKIIDDNSKDLIGYEKNVTDLLVLLNSGEIANEVGASYTRPQLLKLLEDLRKSISEIYNMELSGYFNSVLMLYFHDLITEGNLFRQKNVLLVNLGALRLKRDEISPKSLFDTNEFRTKVKMQRGES